MDWKFFQKYDRFRRISERTLRRTSSGEAPRPSPERVPDRPVATPVNVISRIDLHQKLSEEKYDRQLQKLMGRINILSRRLAKKRRSVLLVFEGPEAAGKGGAIRRLISPIDARSYQVHAVAAPTDEERARPYLWRFWRTLPRLGLITIYDRFWYGRVLVERIEGLCAPQDWQRAYAEINAFEEQLTDFGVIVVKFWLMISPREQFRRFKSRETTPYKQYKLTEDDWRNREKWDAYIAAACEMIDRTSTRSAPWVLVAAEDKNHARIEVMKAVYRALDDAIG